MSKGLLAGGFKLIEKYLNLIFGMNIRLIEEFRKKHHGRLSRHSISTATKATNTTEKTGRTRTYPGYPPFPRRAGHDLGKTYGYVDMSNHFKLQAKGLCHTFQTLK